MMPMAVARAPDRVRRRILPGVAACLLAFAWSVPAAIAAHSPPVAEASSGANGASEPAPAQSDTEANHAPSAIRRTALFFALFDCSWENAKRGPTEPTTVARLHRRLSSVPGFDLHVEYVKTDCARENWFSSRDGGKAVFDRQLEAMYARFESRAVLWRLAHPDTQISVASIGGSWGGTQAAGFARLLHERGIRMPQGATMIVAGREHSGGFLVDPGQVTQVVVMLDPVGSMVHLPESVVSGLQIVARDEKRDAFRSVPIIAQGSSPDRRLLGMTLPGSHSDVCGGYKRNGLATRTANLVIGFINRLSAEPLIEELPVPQDTEFDVIHRSEQEQI